MRLLFALCFTLQSIALCNAEQPSAAAVNEQLGKMSLDPKQTFRVRELEISRGDVRIYLTEGVLSFLTPVCGKTVAAVFSTQAVEAGDAEVLALPPQRNERAALAAFTKSPNLDEHFDSALFLFSDRTAAQLMNAIQQAPVRNLPEVASQLRPASEALIQGLGSEMRGRVVASILDRHDPEHGFFYALLGGRSLGAFDILYNPDEFEQITIGRGGVVAPDGSGFRLWTSFRSRNSSPFKLPPPEISDYRITADIHPDLTLTADASFKYKSADSNGRVISLFIASKLKIDSAQIDGRPAEVFQPFVGQLAPADRAAQFLVVNDSQLVAGSTHDIAVRYEGSVIRKTENGSYFVDDRNAWYPFTRPTLANFDLTFRSPEKLRVVSTGEPVSDQVDAGVRTVHRVTRVPEALAGFNLGDYNVTSEDHGRYRVECYSNKATAASMADIPYQLNALLDYYSERWTALPIHSVAVSPIPASFGQGFPGLIYLSDVSYVRPEDRPSNLRSAMYDQFFTQLLLPHEVAHQWWGNLVTAAEYRSAWLMEALANFSALQYVEKKEGPAAANAILETYRSNLTHKAGEKTVEATGPLDFGIRLLDLAGPGVWHTVIYEKGTWVMQMLHNRLGDDGFLKLELHLLHDFSGHPISNEDFRQAAREFTPPGQPDKSFSLFFDTWVYGTGIPTLQLQAQEITVSGVDDDFSADIPLRCHAKGGPERTRWVRLSSGTNPLELSPGMACQLPRPNEFLYQ